MSNVKPRTIQDSNEEYLDKLRMPTQVRQRVAEVVSSFEFLVKEEIDHVFVSTAVSAENERVSYESLWGFAGPFWLEARNFTYEFDVDVASYVGSILYIGMQHSDVVFPDGVTSESRMSLEIQTSKVDYSRLSAVGDNCSRLIEIMDALLLKNLVRSAFSEPASGAASDGTA